MEHEFEFDSCVFYLQLLFSNHHIVAIPKVQRNYDIVASEYG